jgi:CubicO group peptidase (beta-lactamase class C family)
VTPATLYAATWDGLLKSSDAGDTWSAANTGLTSTRVTSLAIDPVTPATLYAGTYDGGVFKSTNAGETWAAVNTGLTDTDVWSLAIDPVTPTTLYAGTEGGLFKSTNGGGSWSMAGTGLTTTNHARGLLLAIDPLTPTTLCAATSGGVFRSTDGGDTWSTGNTDLTAYHVTALAIDRATPATLYAGTMSGGVFAIQVDKVIIARLTPSPTVSPSTPVASPLPIPADWQATVHSIVSDYGQKLPLAGMTLAIHQQGEPDWVKAYGFANLEQAVPTAPDTVYQIGSLSMPFAAAAVMQLVEKGQLDLAAPISRYLEGLPPELQSITLHQLLSHTSGIYESGDTNDMMSSQESFTSEILLQELVPTLQVDPSFADPGFISYGNYILAGLIIEKVSGLSYADYLNTYVLAPAGLQHTSYCLSSPAEMAQGYYLSDSTFEPIQLNASVFFAAGGLCSTADDLALWMDALTSGKVVQPESYQKMIAPTQPPDASSLRLGYGLYAFQDEYGLHIGYLGVEGSFASCLASYPEKGLTIVLLSNTALPDNDYLAMVGDIISVLMTR